MSAISVECVRWHARPSHPRRPHARLTYTNRPYAHAHAHVDEHDGWLSQERFLAPGVRDLLAAAREWALVLRAKQLLTHQQQITAADRHLARRAQERAVGAAHVGEVHAALLAMDACV